jgi:hypothetical protein
MKEWLLAFLVLLNVGLLAVLMLGPAAQPAEAQVLRGSSNYLMVMGELDEDRDTVYIVDLSKRRLVGFRLVPGGRGTVDIREIIGRDLAKDFGR